MSDWKVRSAGRLDDMGYNKKSLRIEIDESGDVALYIDIDGTPAGFPGTDQARVEFCNPVGGGTRSLHTRRALIEVFKAMRLDALDRPDATPPFPIGLAKEMSEPYE